MPLEDALGPQPASPAALHTLLQHANAEKIRRAFDLSDPIPELFGEGDPTPLTDIWPGFPGYLPAHQRDTRLVLCERIRVAGAERLCVAHGNDVYFVGGVEDDERAALEHVAEALDLDHTQSWIETVLQRQTPAEIEDRRAAVGQCTTDAERLVAAVGEDDLRLGLPPSLLDVLEDGDEPLSAIEVAEAVIATFHTDALRSFSWALDHLGQPARWSGSQRAVAFVRSLGFSDEWAGEPKAKRPPYIEVEGPRSLPELHDYQRVIATNMREMLRAEGGDSVERRGMVSMPTGSGKTRVAVQAIVEAVRDDGFRGGVLWVADRDELCEQAVEAWAQVWRSEGSEVAIQLRISRMWSGQPKPLPTTENFMSSSPRFRRSTRGCRTGTTDYEFLKDFKLSGVRRGAPVDRPHLHLGHAGNRADVPPPAGRAVPHRAHGDALPRTRRGRDRPTCRPLRTHPARRRRVLQRRPRDGRQGTAGMGVLAQADHEVIEGGTFRYAPKSGRRFGDSCEAPSGGNSCWPGCRRPWRTESRTALSAPAASSRPTTGTMSGRTGRR